MSSRRFCEYNAGQRGQVNELFRVVLGCQLEQLLGVGGLPLEHEQPVEFGRRPIETFCLFLDAAESFSVRGIALGPPRPTPTAYNFDMPGLDGGRLCDTRRWPCRATPAPRPYWLYETARWPAVVQMASEPVAVVGIGVALEPTRRSSPRLRPGWLSRWWPRGKMSLSLTTASQ